MLRYGSVCSGICVPSIAWRHRGWKPVFLSEIAAFPRSVLEHRQGAADARYRRPDGSVPLWGDFSTLRPRHLRRLGIDPTLDLLVGGTPCQDFSVAGLRAGLDGERGNLTLQFRGVARRFRARWLAWENVPGVFTANEGRDFGAVLACFAGYPEGVVFAPPAGGWRNSGIVPSAGPHGHGLAWRVLDAQHFGVPQRRRRVFVVGYLGDWRPAAAVLLEREGFNGNPAPGREAGQGVAGTIGGVSPGGGWRLGADEAAAGQIVAHTLRAKHNLAHRDDVDTLVPVVGTLHASMGKQGYSAESAGAGHYVAQAFGGNNTAGPIGVAPTLSAHGGPAGRMDFESETFIATTLRARAGAKGVDSDATDTLIAHTLRGTGFDASEDGAGRGIPLVPVAFQCYGSNVGEMGTLRAGNGNSSGGVPFVFDCKASGGFMSAPSTEVAPTLRSMGSADSHQNAGGQLAVADAVGVRRLTVLECERLQGIPDGYTLVPMTRAVIRKGQRVEVVRWRRIDEDEAVYLAAQGAEVSRRGRAQRWYTTAAADGPRYMAIGNAMAMPVMEWIGQRIEAVETILRERKARSAQQ